ncbi:MAG: tRNA (guanosine(46)-N7)-methyltransferase TrmB [Gammaproteobacteria bacterium]|nr:tRNA (guanosine(46)-N7)-methyltransferase TrmB [Gammaproteobacteria bacterium]
MPSYPIHPIKSYIRRERLSATEHTLFNTLFPLYTAPLTGLIVPSLLFKRSAATLIEIGFGAGETLIDTACRYPEWNVLGIEVYRPGIVNVLRIVHSKKLSNLRVIYDDAACVFADRLPKESIQGIQAYFPDPWPKRRHHKRRLFQTPFIPLLAASLEKGGWVQIVTDWEHYAKQISRVFDSAREPWVQMPVPATRNSQIITKFKRRALSAGRSFYELFFEKKPYLSLNI